MGKSNLRWLYSQGNEATGSWLMKPLGSEVAWDQREGKGSRGDKKQGETTPNLFIFFLPSPIFCWPFTHTVEPGPKLVLKNPISSYGAPNACKL